MQEQTGSHRRSFLFGLGSLSLVGSPVVADGAESTTTDESVVDDFSHPRLVSCLGTKWRGVSDRVMGGVSEASVTRERMDGRESLRLTGDVRTENNGGFIQAALNLAEDDNGLDASGFKGLRIIVRGNGETYSLHLRTPDTIRPWQSYRSRFETGTDWRAVDLPFSAFTPYRIDTPMDTSRLRRLGLVAIGREFRADLAISRIAFYRQT